MNTRTIVFVLAALLIAGGTAFVARGLLTPREQAPVATVKEAPGKKVLVAKANLPAGTILKEEDLEWQKWPEDGLNAVYLIEGQNDMTTVLGAVVRRGIAAGGPITETMIARPGDRGFLAAVLRPGMRAISVSIEDETSISGLLFPGDHVDLLLLQQMPELEGPDGEDITGPLSFEPRTAETILEDIRVLAIDRTVNDIENQEPQQLRTVTLELTPKQAEMVHAIRDLGDLSLMLRGLATEKQPGGTPVASAQSPTPNAVAFLNVAPNDTAPVDGKPAPSTTIATAGNAATDASSEGISNLEDPFADKSMPERGDSVTYDYEVSRTLEDRMMKSMGDGARVDVVRGSSASNDASVVTFTLPATPAQ
jgi:pilus assembly protein CpaB